MRATVRGRLGERLNLRQGDVNEFALIVMFLGVFAGIMVIVLGAVLHNSIQRTYIRSSGNILTEGAFGVYTDDTLNEVASSFSWGRLQPNSTGSQLVYLHPTDDITLRLLTDNWQPPEAEQYLDIQWNYTGSTVSSNEGFYLQFSLVVSPQITNITSFSFDILIEGETL